MLRSSFFIYTRADYILPKIVFVGCKVSFYTSYHEGPPLLLSISKLIPKCLNVT